MYDAQLDTFLAKKSDLPKLIVIYGPTGSGKTAMSIDIAKNLNTEIISTDSRQIFRYMDIGTGKITPSEMQGVTHHMIDIVTPDTYYSVSEFKTTAEHHMEQLYKSEKIPMLVGGTGLYIDSLIYDFQVHGIPADPALRQELESKNGEELYNELQALDPEYASELHPNNIQYVIRALEVFKLTGKSKKHHHQEKKLNYDVLFLSPDYSKREALYKRIDMRVEQMFEQGLEAEVQKLLTLGYDENSFGMKSIGYSEFFPYLKGEYSKQECVGLIQQHSRNYAKRQCTWFRKYN